MTLTPVALVKASSSATNASSSACTKYFHRSIASWAFFSGFHGAVCAHAFAHSSSAGPASAPAAAAAVAPFTSVRRVKSVMISFLRYSLSLPRERGFGSLPPPLAGEGRGGGSYHSPRRRVCPLPSRPPQAGEGIQALRRLPDVLSNR